MNPLAELTRFGPDTRTTRQRIESALRYAIEKSSDCFYPDQARAAGENVESLTRALVALDEAERPTASDDA